MKANFNLIYGGALTYNKKDANGNKTQDTATMYNLLEPNYEKGIVNNKTFTIEGTNPLNVDIELLKPCIATIDLSATSNFTKLVDIKPIK